MCLSECIILYVVVKRLKFSCRSIFASLYPQILRLYKMWGGVGGGRDKGERFVSHFSFMISMNLTYILAFKSTLEMEPPSR